MFFYQLFKEIINKLFQKRIKADKINLKTYAPEILCKSLKLRVVDSGDDESTMAELYALEGPTYSIQSYGIDFVASPKHADGIVVVGSIPQNMQQATIDAYKIIQEPKIVIALGDGAINGDKRFTNCKSALEVLGKVDLEIPGNPATAKEIFSYLASFTKKI
ncbi:MAG: hypothetical protein PHN31_00915 [Candidatus Gracilibacteria bacterium]|nr:hypothetical protein [Candidatus Gracilibacteria bacterium]